MPRIARLVCFLVFGGAVAGLGGPAGASNIDSAKVAAVDKAAQEFVALAKDSYKTGQPPRQSDPAAAKLLDVVFNTAGVNEGPPVAMSDLDKLNRWLVRTVFVGSVYLFSGTGIADPTKIGSIDQKQQEQITKNTASFAPELGRYFDAEIDLEHALIDAVDAEMKAHPEKYQSAQSQGGLAKVKAGVKQTLAGELSSFVTPGVSPAWIRERLRPLHAIAPSVARSLAAPDRRDLVELSRQLVTGSDDPEVKKGLEAFAKAINP